MEPMAHGTGREPGRVGRRMTLQQRRALLERIRREVESVVEDIQATAASLGAVGDHAREVSPTERTTLTLLWEEQDRQRLELMRLSGEYESLAFRRPATDLRAQRPAAAA